MTELSSSADGSPGAEGFAALLRAQTAALHRRAERAGIVAALLRGEAGRHGYALLLRNLLPVYAAIEEGWRQIGPAPAFAPFARPAFRRAARIEADLAALHGAGWEAALPLLAAGARYATRVARAAAARDCGRLVAHAYVRVLGDLSGGQVVARVLGRTLALPTEALSFYAYPDLPDLAAARGEWRAALDRAAPLLPAPPAALREAQVAFRLNIALSEAVLATLG